MKRLHISTLNYNSNYTLLSKILKYMIKPKSKLTLPLFYLYSKASSSLILNSILCVLQLFFFFNKKKNQYISMMMVIDPRHIHDFFIQSLFFRVTVLILTLLMFIPKLWNILFQPKYWQIRFRNKWIIIFCRALWFSTLKGKLMKILICNQPYMSWVLGFKRMSYFVYFLLFIFG